MEAMERWLEAMAAEGKHLSAQDPFFCGVATFERGTPKKVRYRLQVQPAQKSFLDDNEPDSDELELFESFGWKYVGQRGAFHIYRTEDPEARELNTDPAIQALTLKRVEKDMRGRVFSLIFWMLVYPLASFSRGGLIRECIHVGTWFMLLLLLFCLREIYGAWKGFRFLKSVRRQIQQNGCVDTGESWRKRGKNWRMGAGFGTLLIVVFCLIFLIRWSNGTLVYSDVAVPIESYTEEVPFPRLEEFVYEDRTVVSRKTDMPWRENSVARWRDLLARDAVKWEEDAILKLSDGSTFDGFMDVYYYEVRPAFLAKLLAWEIRHEALRSRYSRKWYTEYELPELPVDSAKAFYDIFPTVVLQKGNQVVRVQLVTFGESEEWTPGELAKAFAEQTDWN